MVDFMLPLQREEKLLINKELPKNHQFKKMCSKHIEIKFKKLQS